MKILHTLIYCFFLSLQDDLTDAEITTYKTTEGGDITVQCSSSSSSGSWRFFCKEPCEEGSILIKTTEDRVQRGRYSIRYKEGFFSGGTLSVTITQLTTSDTGLYRCGLGRSLSSASLMKFGLIVADALLDGNDDPKEKILYTRPGGNLTVACSFTLSGSRKLFCKEECEDKDILVETDGDSATRGRYSIEYTGGIIFGALLYVSIKQLSESDSGRYRCYLNRTLGSDSYRDFRISVTDAPSTSTPKLTAAPSSSTPTTAPSSAFTETTVQQQTKSGGTSTHSTNLILYVSLTLVFLVVLLLVAVLIFCRNRSSKPGPPVETEYVSATEINRVYEKISEDKPSRSPVEISTVYTSAKYSNSNRVKPTDDYSLVTAAGSQDKADDDSGNLYYSEVNFSNSTVSSANSASSGRDDVIYSVPRVDTREDPPLYSTVTSHQR